MHNYVAYKRFNALYLLNAKADTDYMSSHYLIYYLKDKVIARAGLMCYKALKYKCTIMLTKFLM
jgi:hypothetical protein